MQRRLRLISLNGQSVRANASIMSAPAVGDKKSVTRVRKAVTDAFARQDRITRDPRLRIQRHDNIRYAASDNGEPADGSVIHSMGRRKMQLGDTEKNPVRPKMYIPPRVKIGAWRTLRRLMVWFSALLHFQLGNLWDVLHKQDSQERRAIRLRQTFEHVGGTFVKIGQQMSSRLDFLPQRYCEELAVMLDRYPPFPTQQAIERIERATDKPLAETFSEFDPEPIGSASIACVYQARLRATGEKVAVKVRRPGIRELFEADFRVLDWLGSLVEALTLVRPGYTGGIRAEFRTALNSELDFQREGRLGELFRRRASKTKEHAFTAPRVYFEYSNDEVLVQEFVSGMWLTEILAAVERRDPAALARMHELNIEPKLVARRLLYANNWGIYSHVSFHADPHPANIVVRAHNELVFIDFGASGYMSNARKILYQRTYECFLKNDIAGMAQMAIVINEPLPAMDVNALVKDTEAAFHAQMITLKSKDTPWYERTTARMFISMIDIIGKYNVPTPPDILMFTRATLLYDTLAARLDPKINFYREYERYAEKVARKTKKRARKALQRRWQKGLQGGDYVRIEKLLATGDDLLFRAQRLMSIPYDFAVLPFVIEKWIYVLMTLGRFVIRAALVTALGIALVGGWQIINQQPMTPGDTAQQVLHSTLFPVAIGALALLHIRMIWFRLGDKKRAES